MAKVPKFIHWIDLMCTGFAWLWANSLFI